MSFKAERVRFELSLTFVCLLTSIALTIIALATFSWSYEKRRGTSGEYYEVMWGVAGFCVNDYVPASPGTLSPQCVWFERFDGFPSKIWAAAASLGVSAVVSFFLTLLLIILGLYFEFANKMIISSSFLSFVFIFITILLYPAGYGRKYITKFPVDVDISVDVCSKSVYNIGECSVGYSFILAIIASFAALGAFVFGTINEVKYAKGKKYGHVRSSAYT
ncbi:hypothetical protein Zmor_012405 [Zophobas morio]|uniref:Uncharacterized protein n=1 Tax=Zophobas morio TaxID=2755281 RepID=A0AA38HHC6_9CUCU|nr:hypothetical protein Zmor_012405 [Zophobas morio]